MKKITLKTLATLFLLCVIKSAGSHAFAGHEPGKTIIQPPNENCCSQFEPVFNYIKNDLSHCCFMFAIKARPGDCQEIYGVHLSVEPSHTFSQLDVNYYTDWDVTQTDDTQIEWFSGDRPMDKAGDFDLGEICVSPRDGALNDPLFTVDLLDKDGSVLCSITLPFSCNKADCTCENPNVIGKVHTDDDNYIEGSCAYYLDVFMNNDACQLSKVRITDETGVDIVPWTNFGQLMLPGNNYQPAFTGIRVNEFKGTKKIIVYFMSADGTVCSYEDSIEGCECDCDDISELQAGFDYTDACFDMPPGKCNPYFTVYIPGKSCQSKIKKVKVNEVFSGKELLPLSEMYTQPAPYDPGLMVSGENDFPCVYVDEFCGYKAVVDSFFTEDGEFVCAKYDTITGCGGNTYNLISMGCSVNTFEINISRSNACVPPLPTQCCFLMNINMRGGNPCKVGMVEILDLNGTVLLPRTNLVVAANGFTASLVFAVNRFPGVKTVRLRFYSINGDFMDCDLYTSLAGGVICDNCCDHIIVTTVQDNVPKPGCSCSFDVFVSQDIPTIPCDIRDVNLIGEWATTTTDAILPSPTSIQFPRNPTPPRLVGSVCVQASNPPPPRGTILDYGAYVEFLDSNTPGLPICRKPVSGTCVAPRLSNTHSIPGSVSQSVKSFSGFTAYPNPVTNEVTISYKLTSSSGVKLELYNYLGELIDVIAEHTSIDKGGHTFIYRTGDLPKGVYFILGICGEQKEIIGITKE